jgi:hypothetical protein
MFGVTGLKKILWRGGITVERIPPFQEGTSRLISFVMRKDHVKLILRDRRRSRTPAVAVTEKHHEVRTGGERLTTGNFVETDPDRIVRQGGTGSNPPAEVNDLKGGAMIGTEPLKLRPDSCLQSFPF